IPVIKAVASPRFTGCLITWSTPSSRASSAVPSVEPSSTTSHSTFSNPSTLRGNVATAVPSVAASLRQGIWMISFMRDVSPRRSSVCEFFAQICEKRERLGIRQRIRVLHRLAVDHGAHRQLGNLARDGARDIGDLQDLRRHMARSGVVTDLPFDLLA